MNIRCAFLRDGNLRYTYGCDVVLPAVPCREDHVLLNQRMYLVRRVTWHPGCDSVATIELVEVETGAADAVAE